MKPKILIIDDEPDIRDLYRSFLEDQDYDIHEAEDGQEAFKMASDQLFDLYITDIQMPEMNGVEFMKVLKMIDPDAVIIIVTGFDHMQYTRQALEYGAFRFLTKPVNMKEFLSVVEMGLVERKKLFQTASKDKLLRLKDKLNANPELQENVFNKLENLLLQMEKIQANYIEFGGPGSKGKVWGTVKTKFMPIIENKNFNQDEINIMILSILSSTEIHTLMSSKKLKFNFSFSQESVLYRYRVLTYFEMNELVVAFKPTRRSIINLEAQKFAPQIMSNLCFKGENKGLVIFSGPNGSGKSSLIDAFIDYNNTHASGSIYILEDSIEYYHETKGCVIRHQEITSDLGNLLDGLNNCADYNPSLVVIEDISSPEIMEAIFRLVDAGTMVYATMKSKSVIEVLYKLTTMMPSGGQEQFRKHLSSVLNTVIAQQLIPTKGNALSLVKEVLINNSQIANAIISNNFEEIYPLILQGKKMGMQTLEQDLYTLSRNGLLDPKEAIDYANNQGQLKEMLEYR